VGDLGLLEVKCPNTATHIDTMISGKIAGKYLLQMQWQLACTGREWCDFVSYDPRVGSELAIWIKRIERDNGKIAEIEAAVVEFINEIEDTVSKLEQMKETSNG
jgi:predicted phage-related endonuclease